MLKPAVLSSFIRVAILILSIIKAGLLAVGFIRGRSSMPISTSIRARRMPGFPPCSLLPPSLTHSPIIAVGFMLSFYHAFIININTNDRQYQHLSDVCQVSPSLFPQLPHSPIIADSHFISQSESAADTAVIVFCTSLSVGAYSLGHCLTFIFTTRQVLFVGQSTLVRETPGRSNVLMCQKIARGTPPSTRRKEGLEQNLFLQIIQ